MKLYITDDTIFIIMIKIILMMMLHTTIQVKPGKRCPCPLWVDNLRWMEHNVGKKNNEIFCSLWHKGSKLIPQSQSFGFLFLIKGFPTQKQVVVWKVTWKLFTTQNTMDAIVLEFWDYPMESHLTQNKWNSCFSQQKWAMTAPEIK